MKADSLPKSDGSTTIAHRYRPHAFAAVIKRSDPHARSDPDTHGISRTQLRSRWSSQGDRGFKSHPHRTTKPVETTVFQRVSNIFGSASSRQAHVTDQQVPTRDCTSNADKNPLEAPSSW